MERQYTTYDNTLALKPIITPFPKPLAAVDENIQSNNIKTNVEYRKYMTSKADIIRERNTYK